MAASASKNGNGSIDPPSWRIPVMTNILIGATIALGVGLKYDLFIGVAIGLATANLLMYLTRIDTQLDLIVHQNRLTLKLQIDALEREGADRNYAIAKELVNGQVRRRPEGN